jgi:enediyne biosynthesis protein E4
MMQNFMTRAGLAAVLISTYSSVAAQDMPAVPTFVEEGVSAGITSIYAGDWEYMVGGGVATFDCSGDGRADMLLAGGEGPATFYRNTSVIGGALSFVPAISGLELDAVTGAYPLDIDSDGITDLVLLRQGENVAMRGLGDCKFARANEDWGFDGGNEWSTAFAATWEHGAKWPTLAVGNYLNRLEEDFPWGSCTANWLHRPAVEAAKFAAPVPLKPSFCALSMLFTDWNKSGTPSLRISNDREYYKGGQEQLWHVEAGKDPVAYTADEGWKPLKIWGMGIASYDLDFNGMPEYFLTSMADSKLQRAAPAVEGAAVAPTFGDVAFKAGVTAHRPYTGPEKKPSTGWHAQFDDVNNDGMVDLFVAKGNVDAMPDFALQDPNNLLLQRADGTFIEAGDKAGVASMKTSRGAALADFNLDGLLDLVVVNRREPAQLWRNTSMNAGHWVEVRIKQPGANTDAIGGWIEVKRGDVVMRREITVGGGHASGQIGWRHFGIGAVTETEMRVQWPDGATSGWYNLASDKFYVLERDQAPKVWTPE